MSTAIIPQDQVGAEVERVLIGGDLKGLTPENRVRYVDNLCKSLGLNPLLQPFEYLILNSKTVLYAKKSATEQLRSLNNISLTIVSRELTDGVYVVTAQATTPKGRMDESIGAVPMPASPTEKANAIMKAETKAKRRVTLSICGLGMLDESEMDGIKNSREAQDLVKQSRLEELRQPKQLTAKQQETAEWADIDPEEPPFTTPPDVIQELGSTLEQPHAAPLAGLEQRHAAREAEAREALADSAKGKPAAKKAKAVGGFALLDRFEDGKKALRALVGDDSAYYQAILPFEHSNLIPADQRDGFLAKLIKLHTTLKVKGANLEELAALRKERGEERYCDLCWELGLTAAQWKGFTDEELLKLLEKLREAK